MRCNLWVIPGSILPLNEDGGEVEDLVFKIHKCCGNRCNELKRGVISIETSGADKKMPIPEGSSFGNWSLNCHSFDDLNGKTNGLLRDLVGEYESGQCRRLWLRCGILKQLRTISEEMEEDHYKPFLIILLDYIDVALQKYGKRAVISNA